jgi:hypothetical protein
MKAGPHWPLSQVKQLAAEGKLFVQRTRALDFFSSLKEALTVARKVLVELELPSFAYTEKLTYDLADVYGVRIEDGGWYLKLTIDEQVPEVAIISLHPLERPLKTRGGVVKP